MQVHTDIENLPVFRNAAITIGTFDGVHLGHRRIIDQLRSEARQNGGESVIVSFHPHPRKIIAGARQPVQLITTIEERTALLEQLGVDHLVVVPFTPQFSSLRPSEYIEQFLLARFRPAVVIIGYDHKFGKDRQGDYRLLEDYSAKGSFALREIPQHIIEHNTVSSTAIRKALLGGDIDRANQLLGYDFFFGATVVRGDQRGRTIGFPTANLQPDNSEKIIPGNGVYVVEVEFVSGIEATGKTRQGMMNIGLRPTVDGQTRTIEVHLLDFNETIYGRHLRVNVKKFLRPEQKFSGLEALKTQLEADRQATIDYFR